MKSIDRFGGKIPNYPLIVAIPQVSLPLIVELAMIMNHLIDWSFRIAIAIVRQFCGSNAQRVG